MLMHEKTCVIHYHIAVRADLYRKAVEVYLYT